MAQDIIVICKKCKKKNLKVFSTNTFCNNCGAQLPEVKEYNKCKYCGIDICGSYKFCSGCGKKIE